MKKLILALTVVCLLPISSFADCDYTKIVSNSDGTYQYSRELHICVGIMKRDLGIALTQKDLLYSALELKEVALTKANERADLWMQTSKKLESNIETMDSLYQRNKWLYFGLGILAASAAVYGAGQLRR